MKLAFAGKGGTGKTTLAAWTADYLARSGRTVWMVDADTALSLGQACGIERASLPQPISCREDLIRERIEDGTGSILNLNPDVSDLPESLYVPVPVSGPPREGFTNGEMRLLVMGTVTGGGGCACRANALLKALLAHLVLERREWVIVDLEAGVEHLGRGTAAHADGVVVVSEPSFRGLETAAEVSRMASGLGLSRQILVLNRVHAAMGGVIRSIPDIDGLPLQRISVPMLDSLAARQLNSPSVLGLEEKDTVDGLIHEILRGFGVPEFSS